MALDNDILFDVFGGEVVKEDCFATMRPMCCVGKHRVGGVWLTGQRTYCVEHGMDVVDEVTAVLRGTVQAVAVQKAKPVKKKPIVEETGELL